MAAWRVYGDSYNSDSELGVKSQAVKFNKNVILRYVRSWVIFYNDPSITNLHMEIWSDDEGEKGIKLHQSTNTLTKAQMITETNGVREVYFVWDDIQLDGVNNYHFVLEGTSSGLSGSSHIAWKKAWPDPVYRTGLTLSFESLNESPYDIYFIGSEL